MAPPATAPCGKTFHRKTQAAHHQIRCKECVKLRRREKQTNGHGLADMKQKPGVCWKFCPHCGEALRS